MNTSLRVLATALAVLMAAGCNRQGPEVPRAVDDNKSVDDLGDGVQSGVVNPDAAKVGSAVDGQGAIATATLEGPRITIERVGTSVSSPRYLAAGRDGAAPEVFVITRGYLQGDATFGRFFGGRWTHLTAFPDDISETAAGGVRGY